MATPLTTAYKAWIDESDCGLDDFRAEVARRHRPRRLPARRRRPRERPRSIRPTAPSDRRALQAELIRALTDGPGVVVFEDAFTADVVDRASDAFFAIIEAQRADGSAAGDHFGKPGANDRIWNAAQKLALHSPDVFADYYANDTLAVVSQAWLGPRYQVTSQVNVVNPGGKQQVPHRDYHLGFVAPDDLAAYPAHLHRMSPVLTLQGAVAHCDMPIESGPTMLLPYSQRFVGGYIAFNRPEFVDFFAEHHVQVPLRTGDAVFFNPALYHGAGSNVSHRHPPDGQPAAGLVTVRPGDGSAGPHRDGARRLSGAARDEGRGPLASAICTTSSSRPPRATPSPPTSTWTSRSAASPRHPRSTPCWPRWPTTSRPEQLDVALRDQDDRRIP